MNFVTRVNIARQQLTKPLYDLCMTFDPQAQVLGLIGASGDERLCLMHLGYKHSQGLDGFPRDLGVACSYYSNAGAQTVLDQGRALDTEVLHTHSLRPHTHTHTHTLQIYLSRASW